MHASHQGSQVPAKITLTIRASSNWQGAGQREAPQATHDKSLWLGLAQLTLVAAS